MKEFLTALAKNLKSPILIFIIIFLVVTGLFVLDKVSEELHSSVLIVTFSIIFLSLAIYTLIETTQHGDNKDETDRFTKQDARDSLELEAVATQKEVSKYTSDKSDVVSTAYLRKIDEVTSRYLNAIIKDCQRARLVGLDPKASDPTRGVFSLDRLYISLDTKSQEKVTIKGNTAFQPVSAIEALQNSEERCTVLLGLPGSGKSTFVRYLALQGAKRLQKDSFNNNMPNWNIHTLTPIIIPLGRFAESITLDLQKGSLDLIETFIQNSIQTTTNSSEKESSMILGNIKQFGGLFLFDGLDEVAELEKRPIVVEAIEDFTEKYKTNHLSRFLVTCRTFSYTDPRWQLVSWPVFEVAPLSEKKIKQFIDAWHDESIRSDSARRADYEEKRIKILQALHPEDRRRLREIADNPLILTVMAVVHTHKGDLPDARALVYEECIDLLLLRWETERGVIGGQQQKRDLRSALDIPEVVLKNALQEIAYHAHERQSSNGQEWQTALVTEDLLNADLTPAFENNIEKVKTFIDYCESANGLLMLQGIAPLPDAPADSPPRRIYAFPHLTFEEYLAARYLRRMRNLGHKVRHHLDKSDRWREVVMLLGEHLCFREGDEQLMDLILSDLAPNPLPSKMADVDWRALWMAGDLLLLYKRAFPHRKDEYEYINAGLVRLIEAGALTPRERSAAGNTLSTLGDPRFNANIFGLPKDHQLGFKLVDTGTFFMGSEISKDMAANEDEIPQHEVNLPAYFLGRFPITVEQYKIFVSDTQYKTSNILSLNGFSNHPVTNINFFDAIQYSQWLNEKIQALSIDFIEKKIGSTEIDLWQKIRNKEYYISLPSEAEWEKSARGINNTRRFPWGNGYQEELANVDSLIGQPTAVGSFPINNNYYGIADLSGNIFEWTRSIFQPYPYEITKTREDINASEKVSRVLRGGSFETNQWSCRCSQRLVELPNVSRRDYGFRIVVTQVH